MNNIENQSPANDNLHVKVIKDPITRADMTARINQALTDLGEAKVADMALVDVLHEAMLNILSQTGVPAKDDPDGRHALGHYNQLCRLAGGLETLQRMALQEYSRRAVGLPSPTDEA